MRVPYWESRGCTIGDEIDIDIDIDIEMDRYTRNLGAFLILDKTASRPNSPVKNGPDCEDAGNGGAETEQKRTERLVVLLPVDDLERADVEVEEEPWNSATSMNGIWMIVVTSTFQRSIVLRSRKLVGLDRAAVNVLEPCVDDFEEVGVHLVLVFGVDAR